MNRKFILLAILLSSFVFAIEWRLMGANSETTTALADSNKTLQKGNIYASNAVSAIRLAELCSEAPGRMEKLRTQLADTKALAQKELSSVDEFTKERVEKRLMLCGKLLNFAAESLSRGDMDSILLANRALRDAVVFLKYFLEEFHEKAASYVSNHVDM